MRTMLLRYAKPIERHPLEIVEVAELAPAEGEVCIAVEACAICPTDPLRVQGDQKHV